MLLGAFFAGKSCIANNAHISGGKLVIDTIGRRGLVALLQVRSDTLVGTVCVLALDAIGIDVGALMEPVGVTGRRSGTGVGRDRRGEGGSSGRKNLTLGGRMTSTIVLMFDHFGIQ